MGLLGAAPMMALAIYWMNRSPWPGSEGGRGPMTAQGLYQQAARESQDGNRAATERHLRMALAIIARPDASANDRRWELRVRSSLATMVSARGELREAREIAAPACSMGPDNAPPESLVLAGLCDR